MTATVRAPEPTDVSTSADDAWARTGALAAALVAATTVWGTWHFFVGTRAGQLVDQAALEGAHLARTRVWQVVEPVLDVISVPFIAGVLLAAMTLAVVRRRVLLAVQVALLMAGANLTTQLLKHVVFQRPDFDVSGPHANTLPSGHTTAAASCAVALVLVVPRRLRVPAALVGAAYTAATGISTLAGTWHRPGDVVAAVLVVLAWTCLVAAVAPARTAASTALRRRETGGIALLVASALVVAALAALAMQRTLAALQDAPEAWHATGLESRTDLLTAYGGGALGILAVVLAAFAAVLLLLRAGERRLDARG